VTAHPQWQVARCDAARRLAAQSRGLRHLGREARFARIALASLTEPLRSPLASTAPTAALSAEPDLGAGLRERVGATAVRDDTLSPAQAVVGRRASGAETALTPARAATRASFPRPRDVDFNTPRPGDSARSSGRKAPVLSAAHGTPPGPRAKPLMAAPQKFVKDQTDKLEQARRSDIPKPGGKPAAITTSAGMSKKNGGNGISAAGASAQLKRRALRSGVAQAWTDQQVVGQKRTPTGETDPSGSNAIDARPESDKSGKWAAHMLKVHRPEAQAKPRATRATAIDALAVRVGHLLARGSGEPASRANAGLDDSPQAVPQTIPQTMPQTNRQPLQVPTVTTPSLPTPVAPTPSHAGPSQQRRSGLRGLADLAGSELDIDINGAGGSAQRAADPSPTPQLSAAELTRVITEEARRAGLDIDEVGP
jgi:phage tail protein X